METAPCDLCKRIFLASKLHLDLVQLQAMKSKYSESFMRMLCDSCYLGVMNGRLTREGAEYRLKGDSEQPKI